jgi:hypothetical protein
VGELMTKKPKPIGAVQRLQAIEEDWSRKAIAEAIAAARAVIADGKHDGYVNARVPVGNISEVEWGWIVCAAIFAWIKKKAEQAVQEGVGYDASIRFLPGVDPQPWEAGAVEALLPSLGELEGVPWDTPIGAWSKDQVCSFAWRIHELLTQSLAARNEGAGDKLTQISKEREEQELDDEIPF